MSRIYKQELKYFVDQNDVSFLYNKTVLVTGASGLIGSYIVDVLMEINSLNDANIEVIAAVRNYQNAVMRFKRYEEEKVF